MIMKLNYITFMVRDIEKTIDFYQNLAGLKIVRRFNPGMGEIAFMTNAEGEIKLEFIQFEKVPKVQASGMTMSYKVEGSLDEVRNKAIAMGYHPSEIIIEPPKPKHFKVLDADDIEVEFSL